MLHRQGLQSVCNIWNEEESHLLEWEEGKEKFDSKEDDCQFSNQLTTSFPIEWIVTLKFGPPPMYKGELIGLYLDGEDKFLAIVIQFRGHR